MSILVYLDQADGHIKKSSFEAASYAAKIAETLNTSAEAVVLGTVNDELSSLGNYGIKKVHTISDASLNNMDAQVYTKIIADVADKTGADVIVFSNNTVGKAVAPRLSVRLKAGLVSGAIALPDYKWFYGNKNRFQRKGFCKCCYNHTQKNYSIKSKFI